MIRPTSCFALPGADAVQKLVTRYPDLSAIGPLPENLNKELFTGGSMMYSVAEDHNYMRDGWKPLRGHVPTTSQQALTFTLELAAESKSFTEEVARMFQSSASYPYYPQIHGLERISDPWKVIELRRRFLPWAMPTEEELDEIASVIGNNPKEKASGKPWADHWSNYNHGKFRFSAAAAAISFLSGFSQARLDIRRIFLHEFSYAVAYKESHALGLVHFCAENTSLRIERRVNVWRCLLPSGESPSMTLRSDPAGNNNDTRPNWMYRGLHVSDSVTAFVRWFVEADGLALSGMPSKIFKLALDGTPAQDRCSEIFHNVVLSDATWHQTYLDSFETDATLLEKYREFDLGPPYTPSFSKAVRNLIQGHSIISTNFDPGNELSWNQAKLRAEQHEKGCDGQWMGEGLRLPTEWDYAARYPDGSRGAFMDRLIYYIDTVSPLPKWDDLLDDLHGAPGPQLTG